MFLIGDTQRNISSTAVGSPAGSLSQPLELVRVAQQLCHSPAYDVPGRLVPTDEDQQRLVDEGVLVEAVSVDLGVHQRPDQIVVFAAAAGAARRLR